MEILLVNFKAYDVYVFYKLQKLWNMTRNV